MTATTDSQLVTTAEAARLLGITRQQVLELATAAGDFPPAQPTATGGQVWPRPAVQAWAAAHPDPGPVYRGPTLPPAGGLAPQVSKVADLAAAQARTLNHSWVGTGHLMLALTHPDCPGAARAVLESLGISLESVRGAIVAGQGDAFEPGTGWTKPTPATRSVLERAHLEAVLLTDAEVTSEHVLLALASHWADTARLAGLRRSDIDPAEVRRRVLDHTEGRALSHPPAAEAAALERDVEAAQTWPVGLELAPTPEGKDPRRRQPWGSVMFVDASGKPIKRADGNVLRQYLVDRDGQPVLTTDGRPVHLGYDEQGQWVLDEDGRPVVVPVEVPEGSALRPAG